MEDTLQKFGKGFQTKAITAMLSDIKFLDSISDIITTKFFDSETDKWIVSEILEYHTEYKNIPSIDVFKVKIAQIDNKVLQKTVIDSLKEIFKQVGNTDLKYIKDEFKKFCINQNLKNVILKSVDLLKAGSYDEIQNMVVNAMKVGQEHDYGHDYLMDFDERAKDEKRDTVPTGWDVLNDLMDGGLGPGEMGVVAAGAGLGKTWILTTLGANAVKMGLNVVHYTMELSEYYVGARYDTVFTHVPSSQLKERIDEVRNKIKQIRGKLLIKYFPPKTVTTKMLRSHIEKLIDSGNKPDLIIVDYADLLLSSSGKNESTYSEQGGVYIELRGLSGEFGIPCWTASQLNRCHFINDLVDTPHGKMRIGELKTGDEVLTHVGYKPVTNVYPIQDQPVYKVKLKSGKEINISAEHIVPTANGLYKSISTGLKVGDVLYTRKV